MGAACGCNVIRESQIADIETDDDEEEDGRYKSMQFEYSNDARKKSVTDTDSRTPIKDEQESKSGLTDTSSTRDEGVPGMASTATNSNTFPSLEVAISSNLPRMPSIAANSNTRPSLEITDLPRMSAPPMAYSNSNAPMSAQRVSKVVTPIDSGIDDEVVARRLQSLAESPDIEQLKVHIEQHYGVAGGSSVEMEYEISQNEEFSPDASGTDVNDNDSEQKKRQAHNLMRAQSHRNWDEQEMVELENEYSEQLETLRRVSLDHDLAAQNNAAQTDYVTPTVAPVHGGAAAKYRLMIDVNDYGYDGNKSSSVEEDEVVPESALFRLSSGHKWTVEDVTEEAHQMKKELLHLAQSQMHLNVV